MTRRTRVPGTPGQRRPATIVDWIEQNRPTGKPLPLSEPSKTWIDRMWHAIIQVETVNEDFEALDVRFIAYLDGLEDEHERDLANSVFMFLMDLVAEHFDELPKCRGCGSIVCPHCGRHGNLEAPAA